MYPGWQQMQHPFMQPNFSMMHMQHQPGWGGPMQMQHMNMMGNLPPPLVNTLVPPPPGVDNASLPPELPAGDEVKSDDVLKPKDPMEELKMQELKNKAAHWQQTLQMQQQLSGNSTSMMGFQTPLDIIKKEEEEFNVKYDQWRKQYDDWREENKSHPNKDQYILYLDQWQTYEKQMDDKKADIQRRKEEAKRQMREQEKAAVKVHSFATSNAGGMMNMMQGSNFMGPPPPFGPHHHNFGGPYMGPRGPYGPGPPGPGQFMRPQGPMGAMAPMYHMQGQRGPFPGYPMQKATRPHGQINDADRTVNNGNLEGAGSGHGTGLATEAPVEIGQKSLNENTDQPSENLNPPEEKPYDNLQLLEDLLNSDNVQVNKILLRQITEDSKKVLSKLDNEGRAFLTSFGTMNPAQLNLLLRVMNSFGEELKAMEEMGELTPQTIIRMKKEVIDNIVKIQGHVPEINIEIGRGRGSDVGRGQGNDIGRESSTEICIGKESQDMDFHQGIDVNNAKSDVVEVGNEMKFVQENEVGVGSEDDNGRGSENDLGIGTVNDMGRCQGSDDGMVKEKDMEYKVGNELHREMESEVNMEVGNEIKFGHADDICIGKSNDSEICRENDICQGRENDMGIGIGDYVDIGMELGLRKDMERESGIDISKVSGSGMGCISEMELGLGNDICMTSESGNNMGRETGSVELENEMGMDRGCDIVREQGSDNGIEENDMSKGNSNEMEVGTINDIDSGIDAMKDSTFGKGKDESNQENRLADSEQVEDASKNENLQSLELSSFSSVVDSDTKKCLPEEPSLQESNFDKKSLNSNKPKGKNLEQSQKQNLTANSTLVSQTFAQKQQPSGTMGCGSPGMRPRGPTPDLGLGNMFSSGMMGQLGMRPPMMGNMGPMIGNNGPMMGNMGPMMGNMGSMMGNNGPMMGNNGQMMGNNGPMMGNNGPMMGNNGPMMGNNGSMMGNNVQMMGNNGPMMGNMGPMMGNMGPMMGNNGPMMGNMGPMMGNMGPMMGNMGSMMGNMGPNMGNIGPYGMTAGPNMWQPSMNCLPPPPMNCLPPPPITCLPPSPMGCLPAPPVISIPPPPPPVKQPAFFQGEIFEPPPKEESKPTPCTEAILPQSSTTSTTMSADSSVSSTTTPIVSSGPPQSNDNNRKADDKPISASAIIYSAKQSPKIPLPGLGQEPSTLKKRKKKSKGPENQPEVEPRMNQGKLQEQKPEPSEQKSDSQFKQHRQQSPKPEIQAQPKPQFQQKSQSQQDRDKNMRGKWGQEREQLERDRDKGNSRDLGRDRDFDRELDIACERFARDRSTVMVSVNDRNEQWRRESPNERQEHRNQEADSGNVPDIGKPKQYYPEEGGQRLTKPVYEAEKRGCLEKDFSKPEVALTEVAKTEHHEVGQTFDYGHEGKPRIEADSGRVGDRFREPERFPLELRRDPYRPPDDPYARYSSRDPYKRPDPYRRDPPYDRPVPYRDTYDPYARRSLPDDPYRRGLDDRYNLYRPPIEDREIVDFKPAETIDYGHKPTPLSKVEEEKVFQAATVIDYGHGHAIENKVPENSTPAPPIVPAAAAEEPVNVLRQQAPPPLDRKFPSPFIRDTPPRPPPGPPPGPVPVPSPVPSPVQSLRPASGLPSASPSPRSKSKTGVVQIDDILNWPGRNSRPLQIVVIVRGLPGSGKTYISKLLKDKEVSKGGSAPRMLCFDDYFMIEVDKIEKDPETGKRIKKRVLEYEYEADMENTYRQNMLKSYKKTIDDGFFRFIIVDAVFDRLKHVEEFYGYAKAKGFQVYIVELQCDVLTCAKRNIHKRTHKEIEKIHSKWEDTPANYVKLDISSLLLEDSIAEVAMEYTDNQPAPPQLPPPPPQPKEEEEYEYEEMHFKKRKWEVALSEGNLDKLDGLQHNKKKPVAAESSQTSMEEFIQIANEYYAKQIQEPGKKRVKWADFEERKNSAYRRDLGFVLGQSHEDWQRITDPHYAERQLNRTKYF